MAEPFNNNSTSDRWRALLFGLAGGQGLRPLLTVMNQQRADRFKQQAGTELFGELSEALTPGMQTLPAPTTTPVAQRPVNLRMGSGPGAEVLERPALVPTSRAAPDTAQRPVDESRAVQALIRARTAGLDTKPAEELVARRRAEMEADELGLSGVERTIFINNRDEWAKRRAEAYGVHNVAKDARLVTPGSGYESSIWTGNEFVDRDAETGAPIYSDQRPASFDERTERLKAESPLNVPSGGAVVTRDGRVLYRAPEYREVGEGESLVEIGGGSGSAAAPSGGVYDRIAQIASESGAQEGEVGYLRRLAQIESAGRADARNGSSTGVFQFKPKTFASVGGRDINDVAEQTRAALRLSRQDRQRLQGAGLSADDANTYILHQQGAGGGMALLTAPPNLAAVAALEPVYGDRATARQAITRNGGSEDMTAGEFVQMWRRKFAGGSQPQGAGVRVIAEGRPKPGYRIMTPEEVAEYKTLDPKGTYQIGPDGRIDTIGRGANPPTEGQINTASLAFAAFGGNDRLNDLAKRGVFKPQTPTTTLFNIDKKSGVVRLAAMTDTDRQFIQAAKEFLAPILRKDTGAAVTDTELNYYMDTYIPRYEDSPEVMWQKAKARDTALRRIYGAGRKAYDVEYGPPGKWQVLGPTEGWARLNPGKSGRGGKPVTTRSGVTVQVEALN